MMHARLSRGGSRKGFGWLPALLWFFWLSFCAVTLMLWRFADVRVAQDARGRFEERAEAISRQVEHAFDLHSRLLFSLEGLFAASEQVERGEFQSFVEALNVRERFPGIFSMSYIERVPQERLEAFEAEVRADGYPEFAVNPRTVTGDHYVGKYSYSSESGTATAPTGFDIASDPVRLAGLMAAATSGTRAATPPLILRSGSGDRLGFLVFQPIYAGGSIPATEAERREKLVGAALIAFKSDLFFHVALQDVAVPDDVAVAVRDAGAASDADKVFARAALVEVGAELSATRTVAAAGRTWEARFSGPATFGLAPVEEAFPAFLLLGGGFFALFLLLFFWFLLTSRRRALDLVQRRTAEIRAIVDQMPVGVYLARVPDGVPMLSNRKAVELLGRAVDPEAGAVKYTEAYRLTKEDGAPYPAEENPMAQTLRTGTMVEKTDIFVGREDGARINIRAITTPVRDAKGAMVSALAVFEDRTAEYELDRQKSEFIFIASHQLRTPLTAIKWFIEMLAGGDAGPLSAEQADYVRQVSESNERMIGLVNDLLNVSRVESGSIEVAPVETDLNALADGVVQELTPLMRQKRQDFKASMPALPKLTVDPKLVRHALMNLLSNAVKYTPEAGKVRLAAEVKGPDVEFAVTDTGMGIPEAQHKRIFQKFFRADNAVASEAEGTGLGLYVCRLVIELSGGRVWFTSTPGKGSEFRFTLPLAGTPARKGGKSLS